MFKLSTIAATAAVLVAGQAAADTINFGQFGAETASPISPLSGVTHDGVGFLLVAPGLLYRDDEGSIYHGDFPMGTPTLFSLSPGQIVIYFNTPISDLGPLFVSPDPFESYIATMTAYDNVGNVIGSASYSDVTAYTPGTNPGFEILGAGIDHVTLSTNDTVHGFNVGGEFTPVVAGVPEPATWALMLLGFGGLGAALRAKGRRTVAA